VTQLSLLTLFVFAAVAQKDRVVLSNNDTLEGHLLGVRDGRLRIEMRIGNGRAELACEISRIARIEPGTPFTPAHLPTAADQRLRALRPLWAAQKPLLSVRGSDAGPIGLALAQAFLDTGAFSEALSLLDPLSALHPDPTLRQRADAMRVQALAKLGRLDAALNLARALGRETDDPSAIAFASLAKGRVEVGLTNLDLAIDHFLHTRVLFPDLREEAAQGLWEAAQIELARTNRDLARRWLETIVADYSNTTSFARAAGALTQKPTAELK